MVHAIPDAVSARLSNVVVGSSPVSARRRGPRTRRCSRRCQPPSRRLATATRAEAGRPPRTEVIARTRGGKYDRRAIRRRCPFFTRMSHSARLSRSLQPDRLDPPSGCWRRAVTDRLCFSHIDTDTTRQDSWTGCPAANAPHWRCRGGPHRQHLGRRPLVLSAGPRGERADPLSRSDRQQSACERATPTGGELAPPSPPARTNAGFWLGHHSTPINERPDHVTSRLADLFAPAHPITWS